MADGDERTRPRRPAAATSDPRDETGSTGRSGTRPVSSGRARTARSSRPSDDPLARLQAMPPATTGTPAGPMVLAPGVPSAHQSPGPSSHGAPGAPGLRLPAPAAPTGDAAGASNGSGSASNGSTVATAETLDEAAPAAPTDLVPVAPVVEAEVDSAPPAPTPTPSLRERARARAHRRGGTSEVPATSADAQEAASAAAAAADADAADSSSAVDGARTGATSLDRIGPDPLDVTWDADADQAAPAYVPGQSPERRRGGHGGGLVLPVEPVAPAPRLLLPTGRVPRIGQERPSPVSDLPLVGVEPGERRTSAGTVVVPELDPSGEIVRDGTSAVERRTIRDRLEPIFVRRPRPRVRRVTRVVRHLDTWSVFKVALVFNLVVYVVCLTAGVLLWNVAYTTGTIDNVQKFFEQFGWEHFEFHGGEIYHHAWIAGLFATVGLTGLAVLLATLFNLITDLVGGIRVSVLEEEVIERVPRQRRTRVARASVPRSRRTDDAAPEVLGSRPIDHATSEMPVVRPTE